MNLQKYIKFDFDEFNAGKKFKLKRCHYDSTINTTKFSGIIISEGDNEYETVHFKIDKPGDYTVHIQTLKFFFVRGCLKATPYASKGNYIDSLSVTLNSIDDIMANSNLIFEDNNTIYEEN